MCLTLAMLYERAYLCWRSVPSSAILGVTPVAVGVGRSAWARMVLSFFGHQLRWAIIAAAFVVSLKFITRNVRNVVISQLDEARALIILVIVTALHGFLALFLKVYFYG